METSSIAAYRPLPPSPAPDEDNPLSNEERMAQKVDELRTYIESQSNKAVAIYTTVTCIGLIGSLLDTDHPWPYFYTAIMGIGMSLSAVCTSYSIKKRLYQIFIPDSMEVVNENQF